MRLRARAPPGSRRRPARFIPARSRSSPPPVVSERRISISPNRPPAIEAREAPGVSLKLSALFIPAEEPMTRCSGVGLRGMVLAVGTIAVCALGVGRLEAAETMNRLAQNKLASNKLASNKLASNALSATRLEAIAETAEMLSTADGREVYSYIVGCALSEGTTIEAVVPGAPDTGPLYGYTCLSGHCTFHGALGLAQHWIDRRLDPKGQRWVSACLFARVNFHETAEAISLRGLAPELTLNGDEQ